MTTQTTTPATEDHADHWDRYFAAQSEHSARLLKNGPRPGHILYFIDTVEKAGDITLGMPRPREARIGSARTAVRIARKQQHTVHEYDITTRDGEQLHIVYIRSKADFWSNIDHHTEVYEIPTKTLLAL